MPGVDKECITHSFACDCREERMLQMEAALWLAFHAFRAALSHRPDDEGLARGEFACMLALGDVPNVAMGRLGHKAEQQVRDAMKSIMETGGRP